jgi:hypothetical protein
LFNNPAQFMTITLGVFLGRFAYDLPRLAVVRQAGSVGWIPAGCAR